MTGKSHNPPGHDAEAVRALLKQSSSFSGFNDQCLDLLAGRCTVEEADAGVTFFEQGEMGDFAFLVLEGEVSVEVSTDVGPVTVAVIGPGELVGEIAAFAATPRTAAVRSRVPVRLLRIEQATIREILRQSPELAMSIIAELGTRLQSLNASIAALTQATRALGAGEFESSMLDVLRNQATRFRQFADTFDQMAREITSKRLHGQEMKLAFEIQQSFLPKSIHAGPVLGPRFKVSASMQPAKEVGGDFFDYFMIDDEWLAIAVGDVSGKGVPAAMFMSVSRMVLKSVAREGGSAGEVLTGVNSLLAEDNPEGMFVTVAFARLNLVTGEFNLSSGGHEEIFVIEPDGSLQKFGSNGPALGLFDGPVYKELTMQLAPGSQVVFATDGVTEAFDAQKKMFGMERLESLLADRPPADPDDLVAMLQDAVSSFADGCPQSDDITNLALAYYGAA
ncbi:SpoIIE family protein phosphatase [Oricola sp.]|uniref:PP2C family protein-serine/threonine phosphatase n=1 Tax=Oricola sp. TaxID=1979950 RepID=UPI0025E7E3F8|nr:SpoIIE family protein phosphatase [Oricola sp.]MCI5077056.1 SpoIIE family protein phosphatase [Oricola sp.]